ncbi:hypothetical protein ACQUFY_21175 [Robbsia andropogonis]|uniref:hypothetical protein n=1 Tax=Robbsia andropogonis TaxID=28092 RepID=UPI003D22EB5A
MSISRRGGELELREADVFGAVPSALIPASTPLVAAACCDDEEAVLVEGGGSPDSGVS